jgi:hypothetical protein
MTDFSRALIGLSLGIVLFASRSSAQATGNADASSNPDANVVGLQTSAPTGETAPDGGVPWDPDAASPTRSMVTNVRVVLVDTAPIGVDPAAATFVNAQLSDALRSYGYSVVPSEELYAAARQMGLAFPVPEVGLVALNVFLRSTIAIQCELRARAGFYFATLRIRQTDETRERSLSVVANQWTLGDRLRESLLRLLRGADGGAVTEGSPSLPNTPVITPSTGYYYGGAPINAPPRPAVWIHPRAVDVAGFAWAAFNPGRDPFTNFLLGARVAWFPWDRVGFSASLAYTNLRGRTRRVSNVLPMVGIETGVDLIPQIGLFVPMRFEAGYLPFNGPVLRLSAALSVRLNDSMRLELDLVQPTIWWINELVVATLDVGAQFVLQFGRDRSQPLPAADATSPSTTPPRRRRRRRANPATTETPSSTATPSADATAATPTSTATTSQPTTQ